MLICSPCFRKDESPQETESVKSVAVCCQGKLDVEDFRARFYCCGRVPPAGFYRKRHGMCDNQEPNNKSSHELDVESNKNSNSSATKIVHPIVPYTDDLPEEFYQGRAIEVQGKLFENPRRFSINLSTGRDNIADLALHFNPRFDRHVIIRNHRIKNKWGVEEILSLQPFPLEAGRNFSVLIFVADEQFLIAVNKIHYCAFSFRIPIERVKCLIVVGDLFLKLIQHSEINYYPPQVLKKTPKILVPRCLKGENSKCDIRRKIKEIKVGTKIDIYGRLKLLPQAFYVNLQKGITLWPHPIISFHMNLRLYPPGTHKREKEILFNSWSNGCWGKEQIISYSPFLPGTSFHIQIICKAKEFAVFVNDQILYSYQKTITDSKIDSVVVHGDVVVNKVVIH